MRKLFAFALICGICFIASAQNGISQKTGAANPAKWTITPAKGIKKGMGRLNLVFPPGAFWSVDTYKGNKFITNRSIETYTLKHQDLAPGFYNLKLNTVLIENVEIKEGQVTTLRTGVLDINSNDWELRSEDGKKYLTSGNKSKKIVLPVGKFQLKESTGTRLITVHEEILNRLADQTMESDKWIITLPDFPLDSNWGHIGHHFPNQDLYAGYWKMSLKLGNSPEIHYNSESTHFEVLFPGDYEVTLNGIKLKNIPIRGGHITRIKTGRVGSGYIQNLWKLISMEQTGVALNYISQSQFANSNFEIAQNVVVPVGIYKLSYEQRRPDLESQPLSFTYMVSVKDSSWTELSNLINTMVPIESTYWTTNLVSKNQLQHGRLNIDFPKDCPWELKIYAKQGEMPFKTYESNITKSQKSTLKYEILPRGKYAARLSNVLIPDLSIFEGYETKLKAGVLNITMANAWSLYCITFRDFYSTKKYLVLNGNKPQKLLLPIGEYLLITEGKELFKLIENGKTTN